MKSFILFILISSVLFAQEYQMHDPNAQVNATTEVNFQIDKYYPVFGTSEKPFENSLQIRFIAVEGDYTAYFNFRNI